MAFWNSKTNGSHRDAREIVRADLAHLMGTTSDLARTTSRLVGETESQRQILAEAADGTMRIADSLRQTASQAESVSASGEELASAVNQLAASTEQMAGSAASLASSIAQTGASTEQ